MTSNVLSAGCKVEIIPLKNEAKKQNIGDALYSKILYVKPGGIFQMSMPTAEGRLVLLQLDSRYQFIFYTKKGTFSCEGEVVERYKTLNQFLVDVELKTPLEKYQRREFFRSKCLLDVKFQFISEEESEMLQQSPAMIYFYSDRETLEGTALDISGGGLRVVTKFENEVNRFLIVCMILEMDSVKKEFYLLGKLLKCSRIEDTTRRFENRIQFVGISNRDREEIIRYIFNQERKARKLDNR